MADYKEVDILLSINTENIHDDPNNLLSYVGFSDNQPSDRYDDPRDKTTFDSIADSGSLISWTVRDTSKNGHLALITDIKFEDVPKGFFDKPPYGVGDGSWVAVLGENTTEKNLEAKYSITFDSGYRGDLLYTIDPKLQIRKKEIGS